LLVTINVQQYSAVSTFYCMPKYVKKVSFVRQVEKTFSYTDKGGLTATPPIIVLAFSKGDQIFLKGG